ncbi:MAG: GNAT family N-acetyltransferase, partial [Methylocella sp.]
MFVRTERLLLRPGWAEDAPALARAIGEEAIVRNLATAPWPYNIEQAHGFLTAERDPRHPSFLIFARTHGAPRLIGGC